MPVLYCRPANALANRLMGISSCMRLARRWGYEFALVWEHGYGSFFNAPYTDLFIPNFEVYSNTLPNNRVVHTANKIPTEIARSFFAKPDRGDDVLIEGWHHFCFDIDDMGKSTLVLTNEIRNEFAANIQMTPTVQQLYQAFGGSDEKTYNIGVHIRKGALEWTGIADICSTQQMLRFYGALASLVQPSSVYITGTSPVDNAEFFLGIKDTVREARISPGMAFEATLMNHAIAIGDLYQLSRCETILRLGSTTYSGLAAVLGDRDLYTIVSKTEWSKQEPHVLSGAGL